MKICNRCNVEKEDSFFCKDISSKDGLRGFCKECKNNKKQAECIICGNKFIKHAWLQKTCGYECAKKNEYNKRQEHYKKTYKAHPIFAKIKKCRYCGKDFSRRKSEYCSNDCSNSNLSKERLGELNPAYRNGLYITKGRSKEARHIAMGYGEKYFGRQAKKILQKQIDTLGYSYCELCMKSSEPRYETHHIIYRSEAPKHENLHNERNLIRLCVKCHNGFHSNKNSRSELVVNRKLRELFPEHNLQKYLYDNITDEK